MEDEVAKVDPKNLEIRLARFETFRPKDGYGTIAMFDVVVVDIIEIRNFKLRRHCEEFPIAGLFSRPRG